MEYLFIAIAIGIGFLLKKTKEGEPVNKASESEKKITTGPNVITQIKKPISDIWIPSTMIDAGWGVEGKIIGPGQIETEVITTPEKISNVVEGVSEVKPMYGSAKVRIRAI